MAKVSRSCSFRNELGATESMMALIFMALDHSVSSVENGGPLIPFVIFVDSSGEKQLRRFVADSLEKGRAMALEFVGALPASTERYAVATDGYLRSESTREDAVVVEGSERGMAEAIIFAQRYSPKRLWRIARPVGNPAYIGNTANVLAGTA
jgi:hypothetical protein